MALRSISHWPRHSAVRGAFLTALAGAVLWALPLGDGLERLSYDLATVFSARTGFPELVLVEMDEPSHDHLKQDRGQPWSRQLHAQLVEHLRRDGARAIVFDAEFYEQGVDAAATEKLAAALRAHGRVALAAALAHIGKPGFGGTTVRRPVPELLVTGVVWGVSWTLPGPKGEEDGVVRLHPRGRDPDPSLPWVAAQLVAVHARDANARHDRERWVRHYGPSGVLPRVSYWQATNEAPGFYRDKTVFIGGRPGTGFVGEASDQFRTPWSRWNGTPVSGLELTATAWLNLVRGDWLARARRGPEFIALLLFGLAVGAGVAGGSWRRGTMVGIVALATAIGVGAWLWHVNVWCDWAVAAFVQVPIAFVWRVVHRYRELRREKEWLEAPLGDLFSEPAPKSGGEAGAPVVPDFEMLSCIGRGAYGEVWLARDVLGGFRAVKIVRRIAFDDDGPYEREFGGLQMFAPVSRQHPGLVQVLHVGLNRTAGYFYYVMEAADDRQAGPQIDPARYAPRTLLSELRDGRFDAARVAALGIALCDALEFLHGRGLIHRDIKPANVIFVSGQPKLADIGLVTAASTQVGAATQIGTPGFIPPEGAGTVAADVFAVGTLLEQALGEARANAASTALHAIIEQARAVDIPARFASARELGEALRDWQKRFGP